MIIQKRLMGLRYLFLNPHLYPREPVDFPKVEGEGEALTSSAYFLHSAASFSSGVLSVFSVCISNVISFPEKHRE